MNASELLPAWLRAFRHGFAPVMSERALAGLADGLRDDDPRLIQGATTCPPPLQCVRDWPVEAADALGYAGWMGAGIGTVGDVEEYFARACFAADNLLGEPAACRHFLNFWDDTPRPEAIRLLLEEVERELATRIPLK